MNALAGSLLLGSVHGVLLALALVRRTRNRRANRYLAAVLGALALLLLDGALRATGTLFEYPHLIGLTAWVPFVVGPLVYLYVREMTAPEPAALARPHRHFLVTAAYLALLAIAFFPRSASYKLSISTSNPSMVVDALELVLLVYGVAYAVAALRLLRQHGAHVEAVYSNLQGVSLRWLSALAVLNTLVWVAAFVGFVLRITGTTEDSIASALVPIGSTITIFVIGYFQLGQTEIFVPSVTTPPAAPAAPAPEKPAAYERARLPEEDAHDLEARMKAAMTERRLYQRAGLTLADLADDVGATTHDVSQVLSTRLGKNFYGFVNEHRIEHVKAALLATDRPVLDLAFEAGFQSKSTFNTAFRKATNTTPSDFRERRTR